MCSLIQWEQERRARARRAQRDFQLRKQTTVTILEQRINILEDTIEGMSNEFIRFGDRVLGSTQFLQQPELLDDLKGTTRRFLDLARSGDSSTEGQGDSSLIPSCAPSCAPPCAGREREREHKLLCIIQPPSTAIAHTFHSEDLRLSDLSGLATSFAVGIPNSFPQSMQAADKSSGEANAPGRFSPRLDYGLLNRSSTQSEPRDQDLQYLIGGPNSFATRLYLGTIAMV